MSASGEGRRLLAYAVAWAALSIGVLVGLRVEERGRNSEGLRSLLELRAQQAALDEALLHVRVDEAADPGALGPRVVALEEAARRVAVELEPSGDGELGTAIGGYVEALRGVSPHLARYATLSAMWRAEMRTWDPQVSKPARPGFVAELHAAERVARLRDLQSELREELGAIEAAHLTAHSESLILVHARWAADRHELTEQCQLGVFLVSGLLLLVTLGRLHRARLRAIELDAANRTLEGQVHERTRSLSSTNRALERAIAEARRSERDARRAREAAEVASTTKSSFLANMSHEIRTPMTTILGYSERLLEPDLSEPDRVEVVATIRRSGEHLMKLVSDVLDLSKIEAGWLTIERVPCSPGQIVADVLSGLLAKAQEKGLDLSVRWETRVPSTVRTDPFRLQQVLINLVGNAVKFTHHGAVLLTVAYREPVGPGGGTLVFGVQDTGIGMDEPELGRLFRPFSQADVSTTRRYGGTGLGLSICKHLVEALGGSIWARSRKGEGSTFVVHVDAGPLDSPLVEGVQPQAAPADRGAGVHARSLGGVRVLLCEDGDDNERLLRHFLQRAGAEVTRAADGEDAVRATLAAEAQGRPFDVVLMDMQMPVLDGYQATRTLREAGYRRPIVALTAHALVSDREACLQAGCDDYCSKPVRRAALLELVARWGRGTAAQPAPRPALPAKPRAPEREPELDELVRLFVEELGPEVEGMRAALERREWGVLRTLAHRLKGAAGTYGFPEITERAALLQLAVDRRAPEGEVAAELAALAALCADAATRGNTGAPDA